MFSILKGIACFIGRMAAWYVAAAVLGVLIYGGMLLAGVWFVDEKLTR